MAKQLNAMGAEVIKRIAVGDEKNAILHTLNTSLKEASIVLITGGLGPTADDITKPLLCDYFGGKMVTNQEALENVKRIFNRRNLPLLEVNLKQAEVPDVCVVLQNPKGTAPGMWFEKDEKVIVAMPGVPHEMMAIMESGVLPALEKRIPKEEIVHRNILTAGLGESFLAARIEAIEKALPPNIKLAYLPGNWMVKLRLTGKGKDAKALTLLVEKFQQQIAEALEAFVIVLEDERLEKILYRDFVALKKTLAIAESCTGGYISHTLTQVDGSSHYFLGGIVSYDASVKENSLSIPKETILQHGTVSEEVTKQMAKQVRLQMKSDIGFGITGWLSQYTDGEINPDAGTVWMAVCDDKMVKTKKFRFTYDRIWNKEVALQMALVLLWKFIHGKEN
jgi:nicotinamide-nucleotide amidase